MKDAYRDAGVDIEAGEALVERIKPLAAATASEGVLGGIGGFGGLFAVPELDDPVLVSGTDGVGTKLLLAQRLGVHDTVGIDLVAMCVNDVLCTGARPLFFLDYLATGELDVAVAEQVVAGIARGCQLAGCALLGGETAEMPGMYAPGHYDLAGFAVGVVERSAILDGSTVAEGDALVGIASSGIHSNGYSLVRKLLDDFDMGAEHGLGRPLGEVLLEPTRVYAGEVREALGLGVKAIAHVTGGGLPGNVPRMLPDGLGAVLYRDRWARPPVVDLLGRVGDLDEADLLRTFNCGLGLVMAVSTDGAEALAGAVGGAVVGEVVAGAGAEVR